MNIKSDFRSISIINVDELIEKVKGLDEKWWYEDEMRQSTFGVHKDTQSIRLVINIEPGREKPKIHPLYDELKAALSPLLRVVKRDIEKRASSRKLEAQYGKACFARIILARLDKNGEIPPHNDKGESLSYVHRIHCPLITNDACEFFVGDSVRKLGVGEVTEINNRRTHAVQNKGDEKRIHLITDYYVPGERITDIDGREHICQL